MCTLLQGLMAVSQIGQANAEAQAYNQRAALANQNATLADNQANLVQEQKQQQLSDINRKQRQTTGTARAAIAANGGDTSMGTGLAAITDIAENAQQDKNNTEYNSDMQSWGYRAQATDYRNQASVYKSSAKNAKLSGLLGAVGTYYSNLTPYSNKLNTANKLKIPTSGSITKPMSTWW